MIAKALIVCYDTFRNIACTCPFNRKTVLLKYRMAAIYRLAKHDLQSSIYALWLNWLCDMPCPGFMGSIWLKEF